eukprot:TRINITY_DN3495_c0_g1_i1.p2 TRINITY_DN3495_c0_g1~~TRINITY_DN3495_c0_g1_i1.p2  ORF type:complete len:108 (-),score=6.44 TRINITY_DN3495_c0_g1_i1:349-672(-)
MIPQSRFCQLTVVSSTKLLIPTLRLFSGIVNTQKQSLIDQFTRQLQNKTEDELRDMLNKQSKFGDTSPKDTQKGLKKERKPCEIGGPSGLDPTRYGDWERGGRCTDF